MNRHDLDALVAWYARLSPETLDQMSRFYAETVRFRDPFHAFRGRDQLQRIYRSMFGSLQEPRFHILRRLVDGDEAVLIWDLRFRFRGRDWCIHGSSHLRFDAHGRVDYHRDYWDASAELYEKLPVLGAVLRLIRRRIAAAGERG
ncbi:MAG: nuclear transport factor 2 family protein [Ectothiorhodospiraceae bacterium]|nr:nuclear transport factor 2 family protein [Ectothiorhodospiraceae bacterium]